MGYWTCHGVKPHLINQQKVRRQKYSAYNWTKNKCIFLSEQESIVRKGKKGKNSIH